MVSCYGLLREVSGSERRSCDKCKKASKKVSANFNLADQVENSTWTLLNHEKHWVITCDGVG